jgi:hypothetical protein
MVILLVCWVSEVSVVEKALRMRVVTRACAQESSHACLKYFEVFVTIVVGGVDIERIKIS